MGLRTSNRRAARSVNFELGEWGFCAVVWSICELRIPSSRGSIRTIFGEPRWGVSPAADFAPGSLGSMERLSQNVDNPSLDARRLAQFQETNMGYPHQLPANSIKTKPPPATQSGGGDCAPEAAACKGLGTASLRPHVQTSRSKLQGRGCSGRDDELRFRRPPLSENALV